jgi:putative salt-induced outer membrane protein YdiY
MRGIVTGLAVLLLAAAAASAADEVVLENGDVLKGKVLEKTDVHVVLDHPTLGKIDLPAGRVKSITLEGQAPGPPPPPPPRWVSKLEAGINGSAGNSKTFGFIGGFVTEKKTALDLKRFEARYFYATTDGEPIQSRAYGIFRKDWFFASDSRYSFFAEGRYDRDRFQPWTQRATASAGVAYKFINKERLFVGFRVGGAATKEWGLEGPDRDTNVRPEGLLGVETKWKIDDRKELTAQVTYYPDLSDTPQYRMIASAGISIRLDEKGAMTLRGGVEYEYDTHHQAPFEREDVRYFALLIFEF